MNRKFVGSRVARSTLVLNVTSTPASCGSTAATDGPGDGEIAITWIGATLNLYGPSCAVGTGFWSLSTMLVFSVIWHSFEVPISSGLFGLTTSDGPSGHVTLLPAGE